MYSFSKKLRICELSNLRVNSVIYYLTQKVDPRVSLDS